MDFLLPFLKADFQGKPVWVWFTFIGIVAALLAFDLGVLHKDDQAIGVRESLVLSAGYISVAMLFGATLVSQFSWLLYLFGAFLIFTGIKMWIVADHMPDVANNPLLKFLKRHMRVTDHLLGNAFWVCEGHPARD